MQDQIIQKASLLFQDRYTYARICYNLSKCDNTVEISDSLLRLLCRHYITKMEQNGEYFNEKDIIFVVTFLCRENVRRAMLESPDDNIADIWHVIVDSLVNKKRIKKFKSGDFAILSKILANSGFINE